MGDTKKPRRFTENFIKEDVILKAIIVDKNGSLQDLVTRALLLATKEIKAGDELFYEKGKNYYVNLGTFQSLSEKEQVDYRSYYGLTLPDMVPPLKVM